MFPQWINQIVDEVQTSHGFTLATLKLRTHKVEDYYRGFYRSGTNMIHLTFNNHHVRSDLATWILLHELAHAIQYQTKRDTLTPRVPGKRREVHNREFWKIAGKLYLKYGVMDLAIEQEYKTGRAQLMAMRRKHGSRV